MSHPWCINNWCKACKGRECNETTALKESKCWSYPSIWHLGKMHLSSASTLRKEFTYLAGYLGALQIKVFYPQKVGSRGKVSAYGRGMPTATRAVLWTDAVGALSCAGPQPWSMLAQRSEMLPAAAPSSTAPPVAGWFPWSCSCRSSLLG